MRRLLSIVIAAALVFAVPKRFTARDGQAASAVATATTNSLELRAPAGTRPTAIDPGGETVLPNGRLITPRGIQVKVAPHPYGLALSPDGNTLVTANSGTAPFSVSIVTGLDGSQPTVVQVPPGVKPAEGELDSVFMGVAIAPDNRTLYVAGGDNGNVGIFDLTTHDRLGSVSLDGEFQGKTYAHSLTGELKLSRDGRTLYVLDLAHFRLVIVDTASKEIIASLNTGRLPFALALSPDGKRAYVSNVGMFEYTLVPGVTTAGGAWVRVRITKRRRTKKVWSSQPSVFPRRKRCRGRWLAASGFPASAIPTSPSRIRCGRSTSRTRARRASPQR